MRPLATDKKYNHVQLVDPGVYDFLHRLLGKDLVAMPPEPLRLSLYGRIFQIKLTQVELIPNAYVIAGVPATGAGSQSNYSYFRAELFFDLESKNDLYDHSVLYLFV